VRKRKARRLRALANAQVAATAPGQAVPPGQARPQLQPGRGQVRARRRRGPARQTRWMRLLGLFFATGGGVAIGFGWAGAAQKDCVQCQIPFLLSGGAAGVGLIIFGVALMLLAQIRTESRRLGDRVEHAVALLRRAAERDAGHEGAPQALAPETPMTAPAGEPSGGPVGMAAGEPRPEPFGGPPYAPIPDPLTSAPVDAPVEGSEPSPADGATMAASTVAGGVVDSESRGDQPMPAGGAETARRRGLFRRRRPTA
jgi:hypothetical protein